MVDRGAAASGGVIERDDLEDVFSALTDEGRQQSLDDSGLLFDGDPTMDRIARLASALMGAPRAFVSLVTPERQHYAGMVKHDDPADLSRGTALSESLCQFAVATEEALIIPDSQQDPLVRNMAPVRSGEIGAYAGVPLRTAAGHVLGTLCVVDRRPRTWDQETLTLLSDLTSLAVREVEQRLVLSRERRLRESAQQLAAEVAPLADAVHSLVDMADHEEEPRLRRYAALTRSRMATVLRLAGRVESVSVDAGPTRTPGTRVDLRRVAERCVRSARAATGTTALQLAAGDVPLLVACDATGLERALTHVLVTALHHSQGDSPVRVHLARSSAGGMQRAAAAGGSSLATLSVLTEESRVPTGELARIVSRLHAADCDGSVAEEPGGPAAIRVVGGAVVAETGAVRAESSRDGRLALRAQWPLDVARDAVSRP